MDLDWFSLMLGVFPSRAGIACTCLCLTFSNHKRFPSQFYSPAVHQGHKLYGYGIGLILLANAWTEISWTCLSSTFSSPRACYSQFHSKTSVKAMTWMDTDLDWFLFTLGAFPFTVGITGACLRSAFSDLRKFPVHSIPNRPSRL